VIAGDHHWAYSCRLSTCNGRLSLWAWRIDHGDQSGEHQLLLDALIDFIGVECVRRHRPVGYAEGAQRFAGEVLVAPQDLSASRVAQLPRLFTHTLARAACQ